MNFMSFFLFPLWAVVINSILSNMEDTMTRTITLLTLSAALFACGEKKPAATAEPAPAVEEAAPAVEEAPAAEEAATEEAPATEEAATEEAPAAE
jgi:hypothetical protein